MAAGPLKLRVSLNFQIKACQGCNQKNDHGSDRFSVRATHRATVRPLNDRSLPWRHEQPFVAMDQLLDRSLKRWSHDFEGHERMTDFAPFLCASHSSACFEMDPASQRLGNSRLADDSLPASEMPCRSEAPTIRGCRLNSSNKTLEVEQENRPET